MTDKLHQSLSSIMDGTGDDLELPRLLNAMQGSSLTSQALGEKWRRYHLAQGILRGELRGMKNPKTAQIDISAAVMQQLDDESLSFTDAGAASELNFLAVENHKTTLDTQPDTSLLESTKLENPKLKDLEAKDTPLKPVITTEKRQERGQWLRGGALAASVALLVITGTQIYNFDQESDATSNSFAVQESTPPITNPTMQASQVASDCQAQSSANFSGVTVIDFPVEILQRKPCSDKIQAYSPLVSLPSVGLPQSRQQNITPVSAR